MYEEKLKKLRSEIGKLGSVAVAFSAGVDSTFLLKTAHEVLGDRCIAVTASSPSFPSSEEKDAKAFCEENNIKQVFFEPRDLENEDYARNPKDRCYYCKKLIFTRIIEIARQEGVSVVLEGSNADDCLDYRPGMRAIEELSVRSPLKEAGLTKQEIRELSKQMGLDTWDKPSFACLASRVPYGERITAEKLSMIDRAEQVLSGLGFTNYRVRVHGKLARIEVLPAEIEKLMEKAVREEVAERFKAIGFDYTAADLKGYRTGSLNEVL